MFTTQGPHRAFKFEIELFKFEQQPMLQKPFLAVTIPENQNLHATAQLYVMEYTSLTLLVHQYHHCILGS